MILETTQDIFDYYNHTDSRYLYCDKDLQNKGINYHKWLKLRHDSINNRDIKEIYTVEGWYILWYLMSIAHKGHYVETNIGYIFDELNTDERKNIKQENIIEALKHLKKQEVISFKESLTNKNKYLHIAINYNDNVLYENNINCTTKHTFDIMPSDFVRQVIGRIKPIEWAIYTTLCTHYNFFHVKRDIDKESKEVMYSLTTNCYAFPNQEDMSNIIGIDVKTVRKYVDNLEKQDLIKTDKSYRDEDEGERKNNYKLVSKDNGQKKLLSYNYKYEIPLYQRIEYIYHCIYNMRDDRDEKTINKIRRKGFEDVAKSEEYKILKNKDFIEYYFKSYMDDYKKVLDSNDIDTYIKIRQAYKIDNPNRYMFV